MRNAFFGTKKDPHAEEPASAGVSKHAPPHSLGGALPAAWPRRRHFRSGLRAGHRPPGPGPPWRGDAVLRAGGEEGGAGGAIGRAACRDGVCKYSEILVGAV